MSAKTRILVLKKREVIYTALFAALGIILILLLVLMFQPGKKTASPASSGRIYTPGVYTTPITLNQAVMNLEVRVNKDAIQSIRLVNLSETVASMFPLVEPALENIEAQVCSTQSTSNIYYEKNAQYTSQMLLYAIDEALSLAKQ